MDNMTRLMTAVDAEFECMSDVPFQTDLLYLLLSMATGDSKFDAAPEHHNEGTPAFLEFLKKYGLEEHIAEGPTITG